MRRLWREPLLHFLVLGSGLFVLFGHVGVRDRTDEIVVTASEVAGLAERWRGTWQRPPTQEELDRLIEDRIAEEVLYREALALGLDRDDTIVRRRLRQKIEFLAEELAGAAPATDAQLGAFLRGHADRFRAEPRASFSHVYVSAHRRGATAARDAERILAELTRGAAVDPNALGDPIDLDREFDAIPRSEVAKQFGPRFADALFASEPGRWTGPIESGYGLHVVLVRERIEEPVPELARVREAVEREWREAHRAEVRSDYVRRLRERYVVTIERPESARSGAAVVSR